jgi:hypothetical protein
MTASLSNAYDSINAARVKREMGKKQKRERERERESKD